MRVLVTGASGVVGSALVAALRQEGHEVAALRRTRPGWDPATGVIDEGAVEGFDAVVHLAGENLGAGRWNAERKRRFLDSRVQGTRLLCGALARLTSRPRVLLAASAVGFYGHRGNEPLTEESPPGTGFLADLCRQWEVSTKEAQAAGIRVVHCRFGIILSMTGGALDKLVTPFMLGLGGPVGSGRQYWSWAHIDDAVGATLHALRTETVEGPINVVSPNPATNLDFTRTLGRVLKRPTALPLPAAVARLLVGEMADEMLLSSARVLPVRLQASGYAFRYPDLEAALRHLLAR